MESFTETESKLWISPIYRVLTRPPMIFGVTLDYAALMSLFTLCLWLLANNFFYLLLYVPLHVVGWIACRFDPNSLNVWAKSTLILPTKNKSIWGCDSYEPW